MNLFFIIYQYKTKPSQHSTTMAYVFKNMPTDITNYIDELVDEMYLSEKLKRMAQEVSRDCVIDLQKKFRAKTRSLHKNMIDTWMDGFMVFGNHDLYEASIETWNNHVDKHTHLTHLLDTNDPILLPTRP